MTSAAVEIKKMWSIFAVEPANPISLRAIWPKRGEASRKTVNDTFTAADFPGIDARRAAFEVAALRLNAQGFNVYIIMNPIRPDFDGRAVGDKDIDYRDLLLIDIDRAEATNCPASDDEIAAASGLADRVAADPALNGMDLMGRVMSGNGVHLYYAHAQMPNDEASKLKVQELLQLLAKKFDNDEVKIDQSVFNASRITKVPGTVARKGEESEGRPYQMARVLWP